MPTFFHALQFAKTIARLGFPQEFKVWSMSGHAQGDYSSIFKLSFWL